MLKRVSKNVRKLFDIMKNIDIVTYLIKTICVLVTLILVGFWLYRYILDEDSSVIENRSYFDDEDDVFPVMSLCFEQEFNDEVLKSMNARFSAVDYRNFLIGDHYDPLMTKIDYHSVTTNMSDFILGFDVEFRNGTNISQTMKNVAWKPLYYTSSWISWSRILKCFGLEFKEFRNTEVYFVRLFVKREIFPNMVRDSDGGFAVLFHYPNQFSASFKTVKRQWIRQDDKTNHFMSFNLKGMEVNIERYKKKRNNCIENWKNYDNITLENHFKGVGCRTPDQITNNAWPVCNNKEKMKLARLRLHDEKIRPCREIESIDYDFGESERSLNVVPHIDGRPWKNWICFVYRILNPRFKVIVQRKDVDFQTLVGYIGGYIGIFTGFAITQIPDYIHSVTISLKRWLQFQRHTNMNKV